MVRDQDDVDHDWLHGSQALAFVLTAAGAIVFGGSLAPWTDIDVLHPFSIDDPNAIWLNPGYLILPAGLGIIAIGSRIVMEVDGRSRPWATSGLATCFLAAGLVVAYISLDLLGNATFQGMTPLPLAFFVGLAIVGSRLPMKALARRPRSLAMALALVVLGALLIGPVALVLGGHEYGDPFSGLPIAWTLSAFSALIAAVAAFRLRNRASQSTGT
jgi:hypothetical protein